MTTKVVLDIPLEDIFCDNDFNSRGKIAPIDVLELAKSIDKNGLLEPITVQPWNKNGKKYRIVAGHRRYMSHIVLKRKTIEAIVQEGLTEDTALFLNLIENLKRDNLNIMQEAFTLKRLFDKGWTEPQIAEELGKSRTWVNIRWQFLSLPTDIQEEAAAGFLTQDQIKQVAALPPSKQHEAVRLVKEKKERGERNIKIGPKKGKYALKTFLRSRDRNDIFAFQELIQSLVGNSFATRCLAWAAGEISDLEIHRDLRDFAAEQGVTYNIPSEYIAQI